METEITEAEQVTVPRAGMFYVATREEAEALAMCLSSTNAWVTVRRSVVPAPNGYSWCIYFKEPYAGK